MAEKQFQARLDILTVIDLTSTSWQILAKVVDVSGSFTANDVIVGDKVVIVGVSSDSVTTYDRYAVTEIVGHDAVYTTFNMEFDEEGTPATYGGRPLTGAQSIGRAYGTDNLLMAMPSAHEVQDELRKDQALVNMNLKELESREPGGSPITVSDGIFNLDITAEVLSISPHPAILPSPATAYFRDYIAGFNPTSIKNLVLEGILFIHRLSAFSTSIIPIESSSAGSNPAAQFKGGTVCQGNNSVPALLIHHFAGGTAGIQTILLQITRNLFGTVSHNQPIINVTDNPESPNVTGELLKVTVDTVLRVNLNPRVPDGATAVAYMLDTRNNLVDAGAKLLSLRNQGTEKLSVSASGDLAVPSITVAGQAGVSGSFTFADGKTITVTNGLITSIV